ncbi:MAG: hypothetical protein KC492_31100 [Myxococcales bacterium]|nr:hypothetical protein [Myxococcales bacterium]
MKGALKSAGDASLLEDFPAAHSMDTQWYAVDEQGHVGVFDTGEDGALPNDAAFGFAPVDPNFNEDELSVLRIAHALKAGDDPMGDWRPAPSAGRTLVLLDVEDEDEAQEALEGLRFIAIKDDAPFLFLSEGELSVDEVERLRSTEGVRWTLDLRDTYELFSGNEGDDGLYHFTRDHGEDPGLYTLQRAPAEPLELAPKLKQLSAALSRLRLPVDFSKSEQVHLADHLSEGEAQTWGDLPLRYSADYLAEQERRDAEILERHARRKDPELEKAKTRLALLGLLFIGVLIYLWLR